MEIIWHGHSCFELVSGGFSLVLDPYCHRELCGYPELDLEADAVLCSHGHYGHGWTEAVSLRHGAHDPFEVETLDSFHDVMGGRLRGENRIHILRAISCLRTYHPYISICRTRQQQRLSTLALRPSITWIDFKHRLVCLSSTSIITLLS